MNYNTPHQVKQVLKLKLTKMGDIVNIRISSEADKIAVLLKEKYYFKRLKILTNRIYQYVKK